MFLGNLPSRDWSRKIQNRWMVLNRYLHRTPRLTPSTGLLAGLGCYEVCVCQPSKTTQQNPCTISTILLHEHFLVMAPLGYYPTLFLTRPNLHTVPQQAHSAMVFFVAWRVCLFSSKSLASSSASFSWQAVWDCRLRKLLSPRTKLHICSGSSVLTNQHTHTHTHTYIHIYTTHTHTHTPGFRSVLHT